jgi:hypothetical protein
MSTTKKTLAERRLRDPSSRHGASPSTGPTYATDRYPPLTLAEVPDYPARLHIAYTLRQRKGVALIGWWLTGIPRYLLAIAVAAGTGFGWPWMPDSNAVLAANRWVISVAACAALLTDEYPPPHAAFAHSPRLSQPADQADR